MRSRPLRPSLLPPLCPRHPPSPAVKTDWSGGHWEPSQQTGPEERSEANSSPRRRNYKEGGRERQNKQIASAVKSELQTFKILLVLIISEPYRSRSRAVGEGRNENQGLGLEPPGLGFSLPCIPASPAPTPPHPRPPCTSSSRGPS